MLGPVESIVRAVHARARTAREVVDGYLERALARNPDLNAFTELDPDGALRQADRVDAGPRAGSLAGVPIALKDLIDHAGHTTTAGSGFYRKEAAVSAPVVDRLEAAGAIIMGRTGLDEFAYGGSSENPWFGVVRNPWDRSLSPGGSSGGSAVAVSAGMAPAAIGTDTGGSVRVPAALCGVVGLKVTHGRVPLTGVFPLAGSMDTVGPLTTTCADARLVYTAMKGFDRSDPWSDPRDRQGRRLGSLDRIRVAVPVPWLEWVPTSDEIRTSFEGFHDRLREACARVEPLRDRALVPDPIRAALSAAEAAATHRQWIDDPGKPYGPEVRKRVETAIRTTIDEYTQARRWRAGTVQAARRIFSEYDLILTPTVGHNRKTIGVAEIVVAGKPLWTGDVLGGFTSMVNVLGCPAISLPLADDGTPPPAVQLIAPWGEEELLLDVGEVLERLGLVASRPPPGWT
ncbi:MAG: amidase [bacterium]|nr:amidase [bacterium]MDE0289767.1 amidase [bacterium]